MLLGLPKSIYYLTVMCHPIFCILLYLIFPLPSSAFSFLAPPRQMKN